MSTVEATVSILERMPEQEQNIVLRFVQDLFSPQSANPFKPMTETEFLASIDKSIEQADAGFVQDADEAIDEISAELGL